MKKLLILAILISGLAKAQTFDFSCPSEQEIGLSSYYTLGGDTAGDELHNMIVKFKADGSDRGQKVVFKGGTTVTNGDHYWPGFWTWNTGGVIGSAWTGCNSLRSKWIRFSAAWWKNSSTTIGHKIMGVWHELGHSYFNYNHSSTGIMRTTINQTEVDYLTDGFLNDAWIQAVDDLFSGVGQVGLCDGKGSQEDGPIICNFTK